MTDPTADATRFAAEALARDDPTGWFERLYAAGAAGAATVPWDLAEPNAILAAWARDRRLDGQGRRALVVGCGLGRDAEFVASRGFDTTAFDISASAIRGARQRHPGSPVRYEVADLLDPPPAWRAAFDLVVESNNVQALPVPLRGRAIGNVSPFVAPGGTLLVLAAARDAGPEPPGPPWPLTRAEIDGFAADGLVPAAVDRLPDPRGDGVDRWRAEFTRPAR